MTNALDLFCSRHMHLAEAVKRCSEVWSGELAPWRSRSEDPDALLERWLRGVTIGNDAAVALTGVGDGSHIAALLERLPRSGMVFCAEPSIARFRAFLETPIAQGIMEDDRVLIGVGPLSDMYFRSLASFRVMEFTDVVPLIFAPAFAEDEAYFEGFFLQFARQFEMWRKMFGTNLTQSGLWQRNTFQNLRRLITAPDPIELQGVFKGLPLIMCGAGPSLDDALDLIHWAQDKAVIVAGNSSIRALRRRGIDPHFILAADPNETTDRGFEGVELGRGFLICPFMVYPAVAKRFEDRSMAWAFGNTVATYLRNAQGQKRLAFVTEQGTVSACAFDLAVILGCPTVFFAGQDLAVRSDGRMHASDTFYEDEGPDKVIRETCRWLPGNRGEKVMVEPKLFTYLKTFEELAYAYGVELKLEGGKGLELYNMSHLGARIEGLPFLEFDEAKVLLEAKGGDVEKGWKQVESIFERHTSGWGRVGKALGELRDYVKRVCDLATSEALDCDLGRSNLEKARAGRRKLEELIVSNQTFQEILEDGFMKFELHVHRRSSELLSRVGNVESREEQELSGFFWAIAEGAFQLLESIDSPRRAREALVALKD